MFSSHLDKGLIRYYHFKDLSINPTQCLIRISTRYRQEMIPRKYKIYVDPEKCRGDACGCDRLCTRLFGCPGLMWDNETGKAIIDEALCVGCGVCTDICPANAIIREEVT